ncbi:MAG: O-antigen ligase family protein [Clostridiales bacterium]|nr:O-antigen ligase family protein [Clostridiales bacterium]
MSEKKKKQNQTKKNKEENRAEETSQDYSGYLWNMSYAPKIEDGLGISHHMPIIFFTAAVIWVVRMVSYTRDITGFYWMDDDNYVDFFSYGKMIAILICAVVTLLFILFRIITQSYAIKKTLFYVPILIYTLFIILSYIFSEYQEFSLLGYFERFEGTLVLLTYMLLLFYAINTVNTEKNVKYVLYPVAVSSGLLGILGISQALDHDFLQSRLGGMLMVPYESWDKIDGLEFTFQNGEIYQTVYNINYVSFYLTLIIPLFGLVFIHSVVKKNYERLVAKILWGVLFAVLLYNMIGAKSSGGYLGVGVAVIAAVVLLNKKIIEWRMPIAILIVVALATGAVTFDRWVPELKGAFSGVFSSERGEPSEDVTQTKGYIDYLSVDSENYTIDISVNNDEATFWLYPDDWPAFDIIDGNGMTIKLSLIDEEKLEYILDDRRFSMCTVRGVVDDDGNSFFVIKINEQDWAFLIVKEGLYFVNVMGKLTPLEYVPAIGFKSNPNFGSGRGYIWSRTLPMMKDTALIGHGADTFCIYYPQNDYVGKYNAGIGRNMIVDKPHNMYMGIAVNTGGVSLLALLTLLGMYFVHSIGIYRRRKYENFLEFAGLGLFLGILGFSVTGLVDDSSVSVMPLFYGLLGTGIAVNMMLRQNP